MFRWVSYLTLVLAAGCSFQASCGDGLNMDKAEAFVEKTLEAKTGIPVSEVTCPKKVKAKAGDSFECIAKVQGVDAVVTLTQDDDKGNVTMSMAEDLLVSDKLEAQIVEYFKKNKGIDAKADCGPRVRPSKVGSHFQCTATDNQGKSIQLEVEVTSTTGDVRWAAAGQ